MARTMKDSGIEWIGKIPEEWNTARLKDIKSSDKYAIVDGPFGTAISTSDYRDEGMPLVRIVNLSETKLRTDNFVYITKEHADTLLRSWFYKGDIIFAKTGATVGKCAINTNVDEGVMSSSCVKISIDDNFNKKYFYYFFNTNQFNEALRMACNGTTRDTINLKPFSCLNCVIPPRTEQDKIASILDKKCMSIDSVIEKTKASIEEYKKLKQAIILQAVTKGIRSNRPMKNSGIEWIGDIPKEWDTIKIKYSSWLKGRIGWDGLTSSEYTDEGPFLITGTDFNNGVINWEKCVHISQERFDEDVLLHIREGDLLITKDGTVGKVAIAKNSPEKVSLNSGVLLIRNDRAFKYDEKYMYYTLLSDEFWRWYVLSQTGQSTIKHLYQEQFYNFEYAYPSYEEQKEIANYLDKKTKEIDLLIEKKEQCLLTIEQYKKTLIYEYVTGKKQVNA